MALISSTIFPMSFPWTFCTVEKSQCFIIPTLSPVLEIGQKSVSQGLEKELLCTLRMWGSTEPDRCEWMAPSQKSSPKPEPVPPTRAWQSTDEFCLRAFWNRSTKQDLDCAQGLWLSALSSPTCPYQTTWTFTHSPMRLRSLLEMTPWPRPCQM